MFRDSAGQEAKYESIAVLEYKGRVDLSGESRGHYICDVRHVENKQIWFRTNDSCDPIPIKEKDVLKMDMLFSLKKVTID